jgi:hypothetical protein
MMLIALLQWIPNTTFAELLLIPPPRSFSFDVSQGGSTLDTELEIREYRNYYFAFQFDYAGQDDLWRVLKLVGQSNEAGVIIPVHLKVLRIQPGSKPESIYEESVETKSHFVHGFTETKFHGNYRRMIAVIALKPELYRLQVHTIRASPEFAGTPSHVNIEWHPNTGPLDK